jgi:hypothetical protein
MVLSPLCLPQRHIVSLYQSLLISLIFFLPLPCCSLTFSFTLNLAVGIYLVQLKIDSFVADRRPLLAFRLSLRTLLVASVPAGVVFSVVVLAV